MEDTKKPLTFKEPDTFVMDESRGYKVVDKAQSEDFRLLEALGTPRVFYAVKANKYYKDADCSNPFTDAEIVALELPIPAEIESVRRKAVKAANDAGKPLDYAALCNETAPKVLLPRKDLRDRLETLDPIEMQVRKLNRATIGR